MILIFGNQDLFLHTVTGFLYKVNLVSSVYSPKAEKDPRLTAMINVLKNRMEQSYGNPYRVATFKQPEVKHKAIARPPSKVVTPGKTQIIYS